MSTQPPAPEQSATPDPDVLVSLVDVTKYYGDFKALDAVCLDVHRGEAVAIIGASGSGKSTLCRTINRLETIQEGTITIDGERLPEEGRDLTRLRAEVGMVFQSFNLFPHRSVLDNITLAPTRVRKVPRAAAEARAHELLERVGLADQAGKRPAQLSGGQAQRVAIARALAASPAVVFADEPTGALDQATGHEVMQLLTTTCRMSGATLVVVTHDPQVAAWCERLVEIRDGRIHADSKTGGAR